MTKKVVISIRFFGRFSAIGGVSCYVALGRSHGGSVSMNQDCTPFFTRLSPPNGVVPTSEYYISLG